MKGGADRICPVCKQLFRPSSSRKRYCSATCYNLSRHNAPPPVPVHIRLLAELPVFPEFSLARGRVYEALKYPGQRYDRPMYVVEIDADHRTIVRREECEEVNL